MFVGRDLAKVDALDKVIGKAAFSYDLKSEEMLFACVFRSERPHARIANIDMRAALDLPGVLRILGAADIPGQNSYGAIRKDQPFLANGIVRFSGEPILIVIAQNEEVARRALTLIKVKYDELPSILSISDAAVSPIHVREGGSLLAFRTLRKGDVEQGFKDADVVVEHTYTTQWVDHAFLETEAGIAYPDADGKIVIRSSTQNVHYKRAEVARMLALPDERIRVLQATTGGGFGGKLDVTVEGFLGLAVYHLKRPVMMRFTREESFLSNTKRHPLYIEYKTGVRNDGTITAVKTNIIGDTGPYASYGETVCLRAAVHATGPYEVPNVYADSRMYYTNNPVSGAMRGFGIPQLAFAHESQLDEAAALIGMDPIDIRMKNALKKGSLTATSQMLSASAGLPETLKQVEPFWRQRQKKERGSGFGLGCMYYGIGNTGIPNPANAHVELAEDGTIILHTGACDIGQGSDTVLLQILLDTIGVEPRCVMLDRGDTDTSRDAGSTSASRQTYISGNALREAGLKLRSFLERHGFYRGKTLREIYRFAKDEQPLRFDGYFDPPASGIDKETCQGVPYVTYGFATHMTEVRVEEATGVCRVRKVYASHDVGKAVNPGLIKGQIQGGVAMGIGFALMEEFVPEKTTSFDTYYLPTSMDMPHVEVMLVEDAEPTGPFGAKGVGEPALIPQAASVINAVRDAVGVKVFELPCDVERLKILLEKRKEEI
jgi:nicotinate dehydrogenase large molybdopterin subunit